MSAVLDSLSYRTLVIMDYVVDIQGFRDAYNRFIAKEATVLALQAKHVGHWIAVAPCSFTDLPPDIRRANNYLSTRHHGIEWFDGDVSGRRIHEKLREVARSARTIYTRGAEKAKLLQSVTSRQITNLEDEECPAFKNLPPSEVYCMYHALHRRGLFVCSLNQTVKLRSWLRAKSVDPDEQPGNREGLKADSVEDVWSLPG